MSDDLYHRDALAWSEHQATLLRRVARGERMNDVDWNHVIEEIEAVGLSALHAVQSLLRQMLVQLLKIHGWPNSLSVDHWRGEFVALRKAASRRFAPSMRQRIDLAQHYHDAVEQVEAVAHEDGQPRPWSADCPFTLDQLFSEKRAALELRLEAASASEAP